MRLIFLSWAFAPMPFPRAVQVERLARAVSTWPLEVVCAATVAGAPHPPFPVHRIADPARPSPGGLLSRVRAALAVPDRQRGWANLAMHRIARDLKPGPDDVLVTFGQPMSDHLAGLALKRQFGCRWIAHFSDPWADNPFALPLPFVRWRNRRLERRVIKAADHVLMTSDETIDLVMRKYPVAWRGKTSVLPHAFDRSLYPPRRAATGPIVLRYLGSLYGSRSPLPLLRGVERLPPALAANLQIEFVGEAAPRFVAAAARLALPPGLVRFLPTIDYPSALAAMRAADLLVQIDAPAETSVFLASKLIDYVGARRPILGVTPAGTARKLIEALSGWVAEPSAPDRVAAAIEQAVAQLDRSRDADWGDETVRRRYDIATVAENFRIVVEQVGGGASARHLAPAVQDA